MKQPKSINSHKQFKDRDIVTNLDGNGASARAPRFDLDCHDKNYIVPNSASFDAVATGHARRQLTRPMNWASSGTRHLNRDAGRPS